MVKNSSDGVDAKTQQKSTNLHQAFNTRCDPALHTYNLHQKNAALPQPYLFAVPIKLDSLTFINEGRLQHQEKAVFVIF